MQANATLPLQHGLSLWSPFAVLFRFVFGFLYVCFCFLYRSPL